MKNAGEIEIIDSGDEEERHEKRSDDMIIVARPNPLEPQPKKRKVFIKKVGEGRKSCQDIQPVGLNKNWWN